MIASAPPVDTLLKELDLLIAAQGKLMFQREHYDEAAATAYGIALLDFMRERGVELRCRVASGSPGEALMQLRQGCADVYAIVPQLPVTPETCEDATRALHAFCNLIGSNHINIGLHAAPAAPPTVSCSQPGCTQTDGAPCAFPKCPQRSAQG